MRIRLLVPEREAVEALVDRDGMLGLRTSIDAISGGTVAGGTVKALPSVSSKQGARLADFQLTAEMLSAGLRADLATDDPEFRRPAGEAARLIESAGVRVVIALEPAD